MIGRFALCWAGNITARKRRKAWYLYLFKLFKQSSRRYFLCFSTASGSRHVVMVSILSVGGYFVGANGGCLLGDQRVCGRRDRIGLDSAARSCRCYVADATARAGA